MDFNKGFVKAASILLVGGLAAAPAISQAADFYAGADFVQLSTELDGFGESLTFTTQHLRLKGGINVTKWLAVEAQLVTNADDKDTDSFGDQWSHDTGFTFGIFAKPYITLGSFDLYGMVGYATADVSLDCSPSCPPEWEDTADGVAYGLGAQFHATKQLKVSLDYMVYHDDSLTYDDGFFPFDADHKASGVGLGVNYTF